MNKLNVLLKQKRTHRGGKLVDVNKVIRAIPKCHRCGRLCTGYLCKRCYKNDKDIRKRYVYKKNHCWNCGKECFGLMCKECYHNDKWNNKHCHKCGKKCSGWLCRSCFEKHKPIKTKETENDR